MIDKVLNREILRLSLPSILANLTVPLVGLVDTAVAGHLPTGRTVTGAAAFIGAISLGAMLFNLLYWNFSFLRSGTGGLTAQAFGREDSHACAVILVRGIGLALALSALILVLGVPFADLSLLCVHGTPEVEKLARSYFLIRVWAAPATLCLMAFSGWFVGMQDSVSSMWKDLTVNGVNIAASVVLALGVGNWKGLGFPGVALGTVIAQYCGLLYCLAVVRLKYWRRILALLSLSEIPAIFRFGDLRGYFRMNLDLFGRSLGFTAIYIGYTVIAAHYGNVILACSSILMQILMIFSYFTDGFAYAGEALGGRFIGARNALMLRRSVKYVFVWSMAVALLFVGIYAKCGIPLLRLLTDDAEVLSACGEYLPWLLLMPPLGCAAFTWDGVFLGATASRSIFLSMAGASACFFIVWFSGKWLMLDGRPQTFSLHILLAAYFAHLAFRTVWLSARYRTEILGMLSTK